MKAARTALLDAHTRITCPNGHYICATEEAVIARNNRLPTMRLVEYNPRQPPFHPELPDTTNCISCGQPWLIGGPIGTYGGYWSLYQYRLRYWSLFAIQIYLISATSPYVFPVTQIHTAKGWWPY